ncbi:hypothetical protein CR513_36276, partial [Mucuna pruriens]
MERAGGSMVSVWKIPQYSLNRNPRLHQLFLTLLLRQSGYPMLYPPSEESMTPLIVHEFGPHHTRILLNDVAQGPCSIKGKETIEGGNKEEDLKRELEAA